MYGKITRLQKTQDMDGLWPDAVATHSNGRLKKRKRSVAQLDTTPHSGRRLRGVSSGLSRGKVSSPTNEERSSLEGVETGSTSVIKGVIFARSNQTGTPTTPKPTSLSLSNSQLAKTPPLLQFESELLTKTKSKRSSGNQSMLSALAPSTNSAFAVMMNAGRRNSAHVVKKPVKKAVSGRHQPPSKTSLVNDKENEQALEQVFLDAGQANMGSIKCRVCGMMYTPGETIDEKTHRNFHVKFEKGVLFKVKLQFPACSHFFALF